MKKIKRLLAMLLCTVLVLSNMPAMEIFAADGDVAKIGDTYYATLADAVTAASAGDTIVLVADSSFSAAVTVTKKITIKAESAVTVTKTGANEWLLIKAGGDVTLEGPITVVGTTGKYGALIEVASNGVLTMNDGVTLKDNRTGESKVGAGVNIIDGSFTMNGGTISGCGNTANTAPTSTSGGTMGGAVRVSVSKSSTVDASFVMNGGTISNCSSFSGGAVGIENLYNSKGSSASFTMNNGTITGCSSSSSSANKGGGAAVALYNKIHTSSGLEGATFTMNGGSIIGNSAPKYGTIYPYTSGMGNTYGAHIYILGGEISGNFLGSGGNNAPGSVYGNGIYVDRLITSKPVLTIGGNAIIDDEIFLKSATGNYFEILDNFTGSVKVCSQAGGIGSASSYGTLIAKQVSATGVASTATEEIAGNITALYLFLDDNNQRYEHPMYDIVLGTNADEYVLGEHTVSAPTYNVTVDSAVNGTVTANPTEGEEGMEVTLAITPDEGYELGTLTVTDAEGKPVTVSNNKFFMPASNVTVRATFIKIEVAPAKPNSTQDFKTGFAFTVQCQGESVHTTRVVFSSLHTTVNDVTKNADGKWECVVTFNVKDFMEYLLEEGSISSLGTHIVLSELPETAAFTAVWDSERETWTYTDTSTVYEITCKIPPAAPNGNNVTTSFATIICDSDHAHEPVTVKWQSGTIVIPNTSPVWNEELGAWTVGVRLDSIGTKYVWAHFESKYNGINHDIVDSCLTEPEYSRIETTLKWDDVKQMWVTLDGNPIEIHVTCHSKPTAPSPVWHLKSYQIKVTGTIEGQLKEHFEFLDLENITIGEVQGNRAEGFYVEITVPLSSVSTYKDAWVAKHDPESATGYIYDFNTPASITITVWYTGDLTGDLYGDRTGDWAMADGRDFGTIATVSLVSVPALPEKFGGNVTEDLVTIICDSDHDRHTNLTGKWYNSPCKVYPTGSQPVWDAELGAWTIGIRIQQLDTFYTDKMCDTTGVWHDHVNGVGSVEDDMIVATLKWDDAAQLWVPVETIELHTVCKAKPDAPIHVNMNNYQIQVNGDLDHDGIYGENGLLNNGIYEQWTTSIPEGAYTLSEVYGSREEGFFIDVTTTLADGDIYFQNWLAKRGDGKTYVYDWAKTEEEVKFTLKYAGDLKGTLYGNRAGEWVLPTTGDYWGAVADAYVKEDIPAPYYNTVTDHLLTVYCDSDSHRHAPVTGKWYKQHSHTYEDTFAWNAELNTWTIDIRIDSLSIMYVSQLEKANGNTAHTIVGEDTKSIRTTLKWDYDQKLWVPVEPVEIHTTCRTVPIAPNHNQIDGFQIQVFGDVDHDGILGELVQNNKGIGEIYTTHIPEGSYTISEVRGSREEGFFVDVTFTISEDDAYQKGWIDHCYPGFLGEFFYDWNKTSETVTITLKYNGDLNGTLHGDRNASNTNVDWVWSENGKNFGVVAEAYLVQKTYPVNLVIYRNGDTTTPFQTIKLVDLYKGALVNIDGLDITKHYSSAHGFECYGFYNDGGWNSYKNGDPSNTIDSTITVNGWTNIICMVYDYQEVTVQSVVNGDKNTASDLFTGKILYGENLVKWLEANVTVPTKTGYTAAKWYNWDQFGTKFDDQMVVTDSSKVYVDYLANEYKLTLDPNGGEVDPATITVTFDAAIGQLPVPTKAGYLFEGWVDAEGNTVTAETIYTLAKDSTITAKWKLIELKVYYYVDGELLKELDLSGVDVTKFNVYDFAPVKAGYTLNSWYEKAEDIGTAGKAEPNAPQDFTNKGVLRLYGAFEPNDIKLTLMDGDKVILTIIDKAEDKLTLTTALTKEGYTFIGWFTADGVEFNGIVPTKDTTYYASWKINEHDVIVEDSTDGNVKVDNEDPTFGEKVTITVEPAEDKEIESVVVTDKDGNAVEVTVNEDGTYSFIQPDSGVTVKVTFKDVEKEEEPTEPEATEPEATEPEETEPETTVPETTEPGPVTPPTGDTAHGEILLMLLLASLAAVVLLIGKRRRMGEA